LTLAIETMAVLWQELEPELGMEWEAVLVV
jgi:hypothetical protein